MIFFFQRLGQDGRLYCFRVTGDWARVGPKYRSSPGNGAGTGAPVGSCSPHKVSLNKVSPNEVPSDKLTVKDMDLFFFLNGSTGAESIFFQRFLVYRKC